MVPAGDAEDVKVRMKCHFELAVLCRAGCAMANT
jgi:hypothetical protein